MLSKKILFCASTASHLKNFHLPYIEAFNNAGFEVYTAAADRVPFEHTHGCFSLPFEKRFLSPRNLSAITAARRLLLSQHFDAISLHTTLASAVVRAALLTIPTQMRPMVFSTCHGYLFGENDGAKALKYLIPEKLAAGVTDVLMVMNREDERIAQRHKLFKEKLFYINGMGVPTGDFHIPDSTEHSYYKRLLGFDDESFLFVCAAELSQRKNQAQILRAFAQALPNMPAAHILFAGNGELKDEYISLSKALKIDSRVHFMGHRSDIPAVYAGCDGCVSASHIEGLPFGIMEALACGLPIAASNIKGHQELASTGGAISLFSSTAELCSLMLKMYKEKNLRVAADLTPFMLEAVLPQIMDIYLGQLQTEKSKFSKAGV